MTFRKRRYPKTKKFLSREDGVLSGLGILLILAGMMVGAVAVDSTSYSRNLTHLQKTADAVAYASLLTLRTTDEDRARNRGLQVSEANMPADEFGDVILREDIQFGYWNPTTREFTVTSSNINAAQVVARQTANRSNPVRSLMLQLVGIDTLDAAARAIYYDRVHPCVRNGFVGRSQVTFDSNNRFGSGVCMHSNESVRLRNNNTFETGSAVSMPNINALNLPGSGMDSNPGLRDALYFKSMDLSFLDEVPQQINRLVSGDREALPDYIVNTSIVEHSASNIGPNSFSNGRIHRITCSNGGGRNNGGGASSTVTIPTGTRLLNVVVVTNCAITLGDNVRIEDSIMATTSRDAQSIRGASGVVFGVNRNCDSAPGTQILTAGSMFFPANLQVHGAQLIAANTINFQANAGMGGSGFGLIADVIDGRTNMSVDACQTDMENHFEIAKEIKLAY